MTTTEHQELNSYLAKHVMAWKRHKFYNGKKKMPLYWLEDGDVVNTQFHPTTDPSAAMGVLKKCLEKSGYGLIVDIHDDAGFSIEQRSPFNPHSTGEETLELAICLFAKKLFSQSPIDKPKD